MATDGHHHRLHHAHTGHGRLARLLDDSVYLIGALNLAFTVPQLYEIVVYRNADGISLVSWVMYTCSAAFWVVYGVAHRARAVMILNALWVGMNLAIVIALLVVRHG